MSSEELTHSETPLNGLPLDTEGRPISPSRLRRAMRLNIAVGMGGMAWYAVCAPQAILLVFFKNHVGASDVQLGLLAALATLAAPFNLLSIFIYGNLRTRKTFWAAAAAIHRLFAFVLAWAAIYMGRGGEHDLASKIILGTAAASWILVTTGSSAWWSWLADLVPENIRATFFGRRSAIIGLVNMVWVFAVTASLDALGFLNIFYVYAAIFIVAGLAGVADILVHCLIPEPARHPDEPKVGWQEFTAPLRNRNFIGFSLAIGLWGFATEVFSPFIWPHVTASPVTEQGVGAPQTWMGICTVISQLAGIATVTAWGVVMDRFGRKPAVLLGCLWVVMRITYLLMTPGNYMFLLPIMALGIGVLSPGYNTGVSQLMLTLTPQRNRTAYVAWHSATVGILAAGGPLAGGFVKQALEGWTGSVAGFSVSGFHVVGVASLALCALAYLTLTRIREGQEKPFGFMAARLFTPGILRTFMSLGTISFAPSSERAARALRSLDGSSSHLALADAILRLDDPDPAVREEAARALGRIGSADAAGALIERLKDPNSTIRPEIARALGQIADPRAVAPLIECLSSPSEELQEACTQALGRIGGHESVQRLRSLLDERRAERVIVTGAEAVSLHGVIEAAWEILPHMHRTSNPVLRRQLAIAMGNLLGRPGEFYQYLTGEQAREGALLGRLFRAARRTLGQLRRTAAEADLHADAVEVLTDDLSRVRGLIEGQSYRAAVEGLYRVTRRFVQTVVGREGPDDVLMDYAFGWDFKLGLGMWFVTEVKQRMGQVGDPELLHANALLALYFLSAYRLPTGQPGA